MLKRISDLLKKSVVFTDVSLDEYLVNGVPAIAAKVAMAKVLSKEKGSNTYSEVGNALGYDFVSNSDFIDAKAELLVFGDGSALEETEGDPCIYLSKEEYVERNFEDLRNARSKFHDYCAECFDLWDWQV